MWNSLLAQVDPVALSSITSGVGDLHPAELSFMHPPNNTYPGEVLGDLAADAIEESNSKAVSLNTDDIVRRLLPEDRAHRAGGSLPDQLHDQSQAVVEVVLDGVRSTASNTLSL